ncbi:MAG: hypothetical protein AAGH41_01255 [Pseudomonadota bacterium]
MDKGRFPQMIMRLVGLAAGFTLAGCTAGMVAVQSTSDTISAPFTAAGASLQTKQMDFICRQFGGARQTFTPDLSAGAVVFTKNEDRCGFACQKMLLEGYAFVDVVRTAPSKIMRYTKAPETCEDSGPLGCVTGEKVAKIEGQTEPVFFEPVWPRPLAANDLEMNRRHLGQISNRFKIGAEQIDGRFEGYLNRKTGQLSGYGAFRLWRSKPGINARMDDRKVTIRACPVVSGETVDAG